MIGCWLFFRGLESPDEVLSPFQGFDNRDFYRISPVDNFVDKKLTDL